eukprot:365843-Chlamydomonas_euryale.AAC.7
MRSRPDCDQSNPLQTFTPAHQTSIDIFPPSATPLFHRRPLPFSTVGHSPATSQPFAHRCLVHPSCRLAVPSHLLNARQPLTNRRPTTHQPLTNHSPTADQPLTNRRPTAARPQGDSVYIPADVTILLDVSPPPLVLLVVDGQLVFDTDPEADIQLQVRARLGLGRSVGCGTRGVECGVWSLDRGVVHCTSCMG